MHKRVILACVALAVFAAFAVIPAIASAVQLTYPTGTVMSTTTKIRAHNVNGPAKFTLPSGGAIECSNSNMTGEVVQNKESFVGNIETATFKGTESEERCPSPLGPTKVTVTSLSWCLRSTEIANGFEIRGGKCSETARSVTFTLDVATLSCGYSKGNVNGTYSSHPLDAVLSISEVEFTKVSGSFLCPASLKIDVSFTLEHDSAGTNPIYIDG